MNTPSTQPKRIILKREYLSIQQNRDNAFEKTEAQRHELKVAKSQHSAAMRAVNPHYSKRNGRVMNLSIKS